MTIHALRAKIEKEVLDREFEKNKIQETARSYGYKIDTVFTLPERTKFISRMTEDLIKKIEAFLQQDTEAKQLRTALTTYDVHEAFEKIIQTRLMELCELNPCDRNVPTYSLLNWVWSHLSS